jgi:hypothetical protein
MLKLFVALILLILSSNAFAKSNPMIGKWTSTKGDCKSFVTEYTDNAFYRITPKFLLLTKRKKYGGVISYKMNLPLVHFTWVLGDSVKFVNESILRFEDRDTMREIFSRERNFSNGELYHEQWAKDDGTWGSKHKDKGKWGSWPSRVGLRTYFRCK